VSGNRTLTFFAVAFAAIVSGGSKAKATNIEAKSVSFADVSAAVARAGDGDTVIVPQGTATWTETLEVTNNITLQGSGADSTIIIDEVGFSAGGPKLGGGHGHGEGMRARREPGRKAATRGVGAANRGAGRGPKSNPGFRQRNALLVVRLDRNLPFRMTGFTFKGGTANTQKNFNGSIRIRGNSHAFRVDHCTFEQLNGTSLAVDGFLWGVIDHNSFNCIRSHPIVVEHREWNGKEWGHGSWADDPYWGSEKFVFIEDNRFEGGGGIDSFEGARFVVRHNHMHNCRLTMHGTEGQGRGAKQVEEYNNTYVFDRPDSAGQIRSGCIITHDNTWTNVAKGHVLQDFRYYNDQVTKWGIANGENEYDLNAPNGTIGYWAAGKHTGPNNASSLEDSNPNKVWWDESGAQHTGAWPTNRWWVPGVAFIVRNMTQAGVGPIAYQTFALSNTVDVITYSQVHFEVKPSVTFNTGDTYQIWKVARLLDQPGVGKGNLLAGAGPYGSPRMATPKAWPKQVDEPCYSWNNTRDGQAINLSSNQPTIKEGRDFFNSRPKPGYKPYTYPHPLVSNSAQSSADSKAGEQQDKAPERRAKEGVGDD
jgi:hypothetical protein